MATPSSLRARGVSVERPIVLRVDGIIAAGDRSMRSFRDDTDLAAQGRVGYVMKDVGAKRAIDMDQSDLDSTSGDGHTTVPRVDISS